MKNQSWATPAKLYAEFMRADYYDPCPLDDKPSIDGLSIEWPRKVFLNPPYCNILPWVDKALEHSLMHGGDIWLLLPSRTGAEWFARLSRFNCLMVFPRGRLKFGNGLRSAPFDCVLIHLDHKTKAGKPRIYSMPVGDFLYYKWGSYHGTLD